MAGNGQLPGCQPIQSGDKGQQRAFTRPAVTLEHDEMAGGHGQIDVLDAGDRYRPDFVDAGQPLRMDGQQWGLRAGS